MFRDFEIGGFNLQEVIDEIESRQAKGMHFETVEMNRKEVSVFHCDKCGCDTPHLEDVVVDQSLTIWHCLICGEERPPAGGHAVPKM